MTAARRGFSLIELVVVLGILWVLAGLLLSAVQKVRAAADRLACQSRLKQIALAAHQFEQVEGRLPAAYRTRRAGSQLPYLGWPIYLAPYVEQEAAWREAVEDFQRNPSFFTADPPHRGTARPLTIFACPTDTRLTTAYDVKFHNPARTVRLAHKSYLGVSGTRTTLADGLIYRDSAVALVHISDGTSNTLLFGERPPPRNLDYGWLYGGRGQDGTGSLDSVLGVRETNVTPPGFVYADCPKGPYPYTEPPATRRCEALFQFWSLHGGGANFALADGSVRFLPYSADAVLPALATRAGGEVVGLPE